MEQRQAAPARRCPARWRWRWQEAAAGALPTSWFAQPAASRGACSRTGQLGRQRRGCGSLVAVAAACVCPPASLGCRRLAHAAAVACDRFIVLCLHTFCTWGDSSPKLWYIRQPSWLGVMAWETRGGNSTQHCWCRPPVNASLLVPATIFSGQRARGCSRRRALSRCRVARTSAGRESPPAATAPSDASDRTECRNVQSNERATGRPQTPAAAASPAAGRRKPAAGAPDGRPAADRHRVQGHQVCSEGPGHRQAAGNPQRRQRQGAWGWHVPALSRRPPPAVQAAGRLSCLLSHSLCWPGGPCNLVCAVLRLRNERRAGGG